MDEVPRTAWLFTFALGGAAFLGVSLRSNARETSVSRLMFLLGCFILLFAGFLLLKHNDGQFRPSPLLAALWGALLGARAGYIGQSISTAILRSLFLIPFGLLIAIDLLVSGKSSSPKQSPLSLAAAVGQIDTVQSLIRDGADVHAVDGKGATALHLAVLNDQAEVVDLLLQAGANPELPTKSGVTARALAEKRNVPAVVRLFEKP